MIDVITHLQQARTAPGEEVSAPQAALALTDDTITLRLAHDDLVMPLFKGAIRASLEMTRNGIDWFEVAAFESGGGAGRTGAQLIARQGQADPQLTYYLPAALRGLPWRTRFVSRRPTLSSLRVVSEQRNWVEHPGRPPASVSFDAKTSADGVNVGTISWSHVPSGTPDGVVIGTCTADDSGGTAGASSWSYGSSTPTLIDSQAQAGVIWVRTSMFQQISPPSGTQTVTFNYNSSNHYGTAWAVTVVGNHLTTMITGSAKAGGTGTALSVAPTSASGELVLDAFISLRVPATTYTVGSGQTERHNAAPWANGRVCLSTEPGAAGSVTMSWTGAATANAWAHMAASIKASTATTPDGWQNQPPHHPAMLQSPKVLPYHPQDTGRFARKRAA